jgi:membrane-associated phospholipid phosphatase
LPRRSVLFHRAPRGPGGRLPATVHASRGIERSWSPLLAVAGALAVAAAASGRGGRDLDYRFYRAVNGGAGAAADRFFKGITELGSIWASVGASAVLARGGRKRAAMDGLAAAGAMWAVGQVAKKLYRRPRPYDALPPTRLLIAEPRGTSWPSSHPAVLLAFLTVSLRDLEAPAPTRNLAAALAGAVAVSRVYLGVHFPSDVLGGLLLGRALADVWTAAVSPRTVGRVRGASSVQ